MNKPSLAHLKIYFLVLLVIVVSSAAAPGLIAHAMQQPLKT